MAVLAQDATVATGTAPRLPVVLVVDTSWSVARSGLLAVVNDALGRWPEEVRANSRVCRHAEFALVTFGKDGVNVSPLAATHTPSRSADSAFLPAPEVVPPTLTADGVTPIAEALDLALSLCAGRLKAIEAANLHAYVPNIWLLTDGEPTDALGDPSDDWRAIVPRLRHAEEADEALFFAVGLPGARMEVLTELAPNSTFGSADLSFASALALITMSSGELARGDGSAARDRYALVRELVDEQSPWAHT
jgi:uncharacterized protein YegL